MLGFSFHLSRMSCSIHGRQRQPDREAWQVKGEEASYAFVGIASQLLFHDAGGQG